MPKKLGRVFLELPFSIERLGGINTLVSKFTGYLFNSCLV